ncbi:hypothetical protein HYFRA_00005421 [Hymenoscyphus fraxineus]|uniref:Uncharacterized protein n=1 Tax=Hymenoscyphus fraxineus TaxID=746836 RepID=A0A9N9PLW6_9HELO|nr:hypothetical protein HYFRA_00005421 [Hymenoscyphus fraxineus]
MMCGVYYIGKALEAVSIQLRIGKFEVGENWQCQDCSTNNTPLCADCKDSWLHELSSLEYSNRFERRVGFLSGVSAIMMGLMAFLGNTSMTLWQSGPLLNSITSVLPTPSLSAPWQTVYNYTLLLLFLTSTLVLCSAQIICMFLTMMNPTTTRHWRHMTATVWAVVGISAIITMILSVYNPLGDLILVFWPVMTGLVNCGVAWGMDVREGEGRIMLAADGGEKV